METLNKHRRQADRMSLRADMAIPAVPVEASMSARWWTFHRESCLLRGVCHVCTWFCRVILLPVGAHGRENYGSSSGSTLEARATFGLELAYAS